MKIKSLHTKCPGSHRLLCGVLIMGQVLLPLRAMAGVSTDGSVGAATTLAGPAYAIPQSLGTLSSGGTNLYHSFSSFNLAAGESANFTTSTAGINNVISRVTGGASTINGAINLTPASGTPAFWFINPAGVTFGAGSSVSVPGAFHVSTANYLKFPDGNFYADTTRTSTFSSADPTAFGFLGAAPAAVTVNGGTTLSPGQAFSIVAGDVTFDNGNINNLSGDLRIVAFGAGSGEVSMSGSVPAAAGVVSITNNSYVGTDTTTSTNAGNVSVGAGSLVIDGFSTLAASTNGLGNAGNVEVMASGNLNISTYGWIASDTYGSGDAGTVKVRAGNITVYDPWGTSGISSEVLGGSTGNAGNIDIATTGTTGTLTLDSGGVIRSIGRGIGNAGTVKVSAENILITNGWSYISSDTFGTGNAGTVNVSANSIKINNGYISSDTNGTGNAGTVNVSANNIKIDNGFISSDTYGTGHGGNVEVMASGNLDISNSGWITSDTYAAGDAGTVKVSAGNITIYDLLGISGISSEVLGTKTGNAGSVDVATTGTLTLDTGGVIRSIGRGLGNAGTVKVSAGNILITNGWSYISSDTFGTGNAGTVDVSAKNILITDGYISSDTLGTGNAGTVNVSAATIRIDGNYSYISSDGIGAGNAGNVAVSAAGHLSITNGGEISSATYDAGNAGHVTVSANTLSIDAASSSINASARSGSSGQTGNVTVNVADSIWITNGGEVAIRNDATSATMISPITPTLLTVNAANVTLLNNGQITSASTGDVNASNISVYVNNKLWLDPTAITSSAVNGNGGSIAIQSGNMIILDRSMVTTSVTGITNGNAGSISIKAPVMVMNNGFIQANTSAPLASGGTITINVDNLIASYGSLFVGGSTPYVFDAITPGFNVIQAASATGVSGSVTITSPKLDLAGSLAGLKAGALQNGSFSRSPCAASGGSSFAQAGRGGLPTSSFGLMRAEGLQGVMGSAGFSGMGTSTSLASAGFGCGA